MTGTTSKLELSAQTAETETQKVYDRRSLTYSNTFDSPAKALLIRAIEILTAKLRIIARVKEFERRGAPTGQEFWHRVMEVMGIAIQTPDEEIARIPATGPVVLVANHPHGLVDGIILADLIGRRRTDYRILTRALLTGIDESASSYMIPVPFPHEPDAQEKMLAMREKAMEHLAAGGLVALFPSGAVAVSETWFGPAVEGEWNVFTAKMIRLSGAKVVPLKFQGSNTRAYHIANRISATLRQSLLLREVVKAFDKPQRPIIGEPLPEAEVTERLKSPRAFMAWLRELTLAMSTRP